MKSHDASFLVIGYGNELRGDDAVGPFVARAIEQKKLPGVHVLVCQQLTPEIADDVARAGAVVFVDASVDAREVQVHDVAPAAGANAINHSNTPAATLALAEAAFHRAPRAWWITIPITALEFSRDLSPLAREGAAIAIRHIKGLAMYSAARAPVAA